MGTKIDCNSSAVSSAVVNVRGAKGQTFTGKLINHKTATAPYKNDDGSDKQMHIFEFIPVDTDMALMRRDANKEYQETEVKEGETVCIFPPTRLLLGLNQVAVGSTVKITYMGLGKAGKRGGKPHTYELEVL